MISWKHSFNRLKEEYEIAVKKKDALDGLLSAGKISQSTYDIFRKEIEDSMIETEKQQRALVAKMLSKSLALEAQIKTLETLLADSEIQHVTGEIEDDIYQQQNDLLMIGLESMKTELSHVRDAMSKLSNGLVNVNCETESGLEENIDVSKATTESEVQIPVVEAEKTSEDSTSTGESVEPLAVEAEAREPQQEN
jgi:hypothetical protein